MAGNAAAVRVAVSGVVTKGPSAAPTGTAGALTGGKDLGLISEDGVDLTYPGAGDATPIKQWDGTTVRTIRKPSDESPTWQFTMLESSKDVVEAALGVTITGSAADGSFEYKVQNQAHDKWVIDYVDGTELIRDYIPYGVVTEVAAQKYGSTDAIKWTITLAGELDPTAGFNFKRFATAWKTP